MKIYLSGPLSDPDQPDLKAKFASTAQFMTELGFTPISATLNDQHTKPIPWIERLCGHITLLNECNHIYMMNGWQHCRSSCIEYDFAVRSNIHVLFESQMINNNPTVERIQHAIHVVTGLHLNDYSANSRKQELVYARMLFVWHCRKCNMLDRHIATYIKRNRSTISHSVKRYHNELKYNQAFRQIAERVNLMLNQDDNE